MSLQGWRRVTWIYHLLFLFAVVWPGQSWINTPRPLVLGLPFQMVWIALWVVGSLFVLWGLDTAEARNRNHRGGRG